ncbi:MAG: FAD-linked oxidase C-terminal domain-containing protein, partial [Methyloligellaceae bacterium]
AMCAALGTPFEISAAAHLQEPFVLHLSDADLSAAGASVTALRIENFTSSVTYRTDELKKILKPFGDISVLEGGQSRLFWSDMRQLKILQHSNDTLWRLSVPPKSGADVVESIRAHHPTCAAVYDWSGGLIWLLVPPISDAGASEVRRAVGSSGGHATLIRADVATRAAVDVFQPLESGVAALSKRIKAAFDPHGILNPGRMHAGV